MWAIISTISTDRWWDHEQVSVFIWVSVPLLSSPLSSNNFPPSPTPEKHEHCEHCEQPSFTTSVHSNPKCISLLTTEILQTLFLCMSPPTT